ncbi:hypothetical protein CE457_12975 [Vreelandella boliviensis LC1]|uniref:Uncharacterized protein n=1 Tax=Vreelandella boliviensis LC1 TaxID=1072583 RepID=A0ABX4G817_9GAMM|nr:hypothetical protein CE457_12975 [Halomonas boliviensis LC1]
MTLTDFPAAAPRLDVQRVALPKTPQTSAPEAAPAAAGASPLVCLDIPDHYELMQPELITLLKERVPESVRLSAVET